MIKPERLSEFVTLYEGDCLASLKEMPDESVQCCVTSPPYYGLRSYMPEAVQIDPSLTPEKTREILAELQSLGIARITE